MRAAQGGNEPAPGLVAPDEPHQARAPAQGRDVVGGIAGAARHHLGGVVLEDQHGRLARHAGHAPVDELVRDQVAKDDDPAPRAGVEQAEQPRRALVLAGQRMDRTGNQHER